MLITCVLGKAAPAVSQTSHIEKVDVKAVDKTTAAKVETASTAKAEQQSKPESQPKTVTHPVGCHRYLDHFRKYDWNVNIAVAICKAESGGNPYAVSDASRNWNGVSDYGLMQLNGVKIFDPAENIAYAYYNKYAKGGWTHWTVYKTGAYLKYL